MRFSNTVQQIEFDMLYTGQTHTVVVPVAQSALDAPGLLAAFEAAYQAAFGRILDDIPVRVMNLRYARIGVRPKFDLAVLAPQGAGSTQSLGLQRVYHAGQWWDAQRYARLELPVNSSITGPAILEQPDTTVWLEPGFTSRVDVLGNLLIAAS